MNAPKFPFLMPVWTNKAGILRPDQAEGCRPWFVLGIRFDRQVIEDEDQNHVELTGYVYLIGDKDGDPREDYGWVAEAELVKAEYSDPFRDIPSIPRITVRPDLAACGRIADSLGLTLEDCEKAAQDDEHPDLDDVRNMPATSVG